jgi:ABC-type multidrug transport system fused ATPase/permease subunit
MLVEAFDGGGMRERLDLLRMLRRAGPVPVTAMVTLALARALLPAASAVTMAVLVGRVAGRGAVWLALLAFLAVLLLGHLVDAFTEPLRALITARIDGAHRAEVARLASSVPTIGGLEDPEIQHLIRLASAEQRNWTERTPGDGAVAQLVALAQWVGGFGAAAVVAAYAWWMLPVLLVPAFAGRTVQRRQHLGFARLWVTGQRAARRLDGARDLITSPAEAKEQRVYGFGGWAVDRQVRAVHVMFDPLWRRNILVWNALSAAVMVVPLGLVYAVVAAGVGHGRATVATETAVLAAGLAVYLAAGGTGFGVAVEGAAPVVAALRELRDRLAPDATVPDATVPSPTVPSSTVPGATVPDPVGPARIELRGIRFGYPGTEHAVLDGLDLAIEPGELLAIVGLNGAGKSTLIKLLAGLYQPDAGTITAGGVDLREVGPAAWRERISVVFQDFVRYGLSAADNITLGHATVAPDRAALEAAVEEAGLRPVLDRLPDGWDTPLARHRTGGVDLSGGQWQQVVLARALYAVHTGASLLVLDEPTAHLDVRSEFELFGRLAARAGKTSVVLISHRLSTVRHADRIVLLDRGRITESGTHEQLMVRGGGYAQMFTIQAERFNRGFDDRVEEDELR